MVYDLVVIGGGPAGYVAAIRAAQLGKKVACVEENRAGGTCLNWGCIPTKSLLRNAELYHIVQQRGEEFGLKFDHLSFDWTRVISRSRKVSDRLAGGIEQLFRKNKVDYILARGSVPQAHVVEIVDRDNKRKALEASRILLATGVVPREMVGLPFNDKTVISSKQAMVLPQLPEEILIVGGGAIGIEFAYFFNAFGARVTLVEVMPNVLHLEDTEVSEALATSLAKQGIRLLTNTRVEQAEIKGGSVCLTLFGKEGKMVLQSPTVLVAIGVSPVLPPGMSFELDRRGYLKTDDYYATSVDGVYGAGDIIGPPWLAHVASYEAVQAVNGMWGPSKPKRTSVFPSCVYCQPQVASVGVTERDMREKGLQYRIGRFPFHASGKALAVGESEGFVKLIFGEPHGELLGAHIVGSDATEVIAELGLAITLEATFHDVIDTLHAHPTLSESIKEAAEAAYGLATHI
ncbi:MAG: dihydrolipoyl dehydrogenase [Candidatus Xiphinematobacter sp.]|nr:MAG: dihydrolipoyl dehydrogenase [Candidatus Xiphinematobacter sp.]